MSRVVEHWDAQAEEHGTRDTAGCPDSNFREIELRELAKHIERGDRVLDVGCGNGYAIRRLREIVKAHYTGLDISAKMIDQARVADSRGEYAVADIRGPSLLTLRRRFNVVMSERCLINLPTWEAQKIAISNMAALTRPGGRVVLCENTADGLARLNAMRAAVHLPPIEMRWHNRYFIEHELDNFLEQSFHRVTKRNIGSFYALCSKVLYPLVAGVTGEEIYYDHPINVAAAVMDVPLTGYSPNHIYVCEIEPTIGEPA